MKPVQAYKCDYCPRCFARPVDAHNHEVACKNNPTRRVCITCKKCLIEEDKSQKILSFHFSLEGEEIYGESPTCTVSNKPIYDKPYLDECETTTYGHSEEERELPGTCFNYEYKGYAKYEREIKEETL